MVEGRRARNELRRLGGRRPPLSRAVRARPHDPGGHRVGRIPLGPGAALDPRVGGGQMRLDRAAPRGPVVRAAVRARDPIQRLGRDPDRRRQHRHVARERLEHRQPEPLAVRRDQHRVGGVDPQRHRTRLDVPERQHAARRRRRRARDRGASRVAGGRRGTAGRVRPGRGPAPRGRRRAGSARTGAGRRRRATPRWSHASRPRPGARAASGSETVATRSRNGTAPSEIARDRGCARSVPWNVTAWAPAGAARAGHAVRPKWAWTTSKRSPPYRRRSARAARPYARGLPGANANSSTSASGIRRSASTWSRTKLPSAGRAGDGYMLVMTKARTEGRERIGLPSPTRPSPGA